MRVAITQQNVLYAQYLHCPRLSDMILPFLPLAFSLAKESSTKTNFDFATTDICHLSDGLSLFGVITVAARLWSSIFVILDDGNSLLQLHF